MEGPPGSSGDEVWKPKGNPWIIAVAVSLAAFMEVLDTSIANVALPHIAGNLGASNDESTWVLTSYLVSNAIVLPISGWLVGWLGRTPAPPCHDGRCGPDPGRRSSPRPIGAGRSVGAQQPPVLRHRGVP